MESQCFSKAIQIISNHPNSTFNLFASNATQQPLIISVSPSVSYKIYRFLQQDSCAVAQLILKNRTTIQIRPSYKILFMKEIQLICQKSFKQFNIQHKYFEKTSQNVLNFTDKIDQIENFLFQFKIHLQNNQLKIHFYQIESTLQYIVIDQTDLLKNFIIFLKLTEEAIMQLFSKIGLIKPSFSERLANNLKIQRQKNIMRRILKSRKENQLQDENQLMQTEISQSKNGIFQSIELIRQQPIDPSEITFKRGGYFNIEKKKFIVRNNLQPQNKVSIKILAQKKLSKRKRPNTIFNYQGKMAKQINLLKHLNQLNPFQLKNFAQYYLVSQPLRIYIDPNSMIDQNDSISKDSLSTASNELSLQNGLEEAIYMDYYDQNLEEYLQKKGRLDIFQVIFLLKQIFESVMLLHKVGIVHRDIKPANFMIQYLQDLSPKTKLIDFGESTHVTDQYTKQKVLGYTAMYAPIQCANSCKEGFNSKFVDLWSVGVVVYHLTTGRFPVNHSNCFRSDIRIGWPTDLSFFHTQYLRGKWLLAQNLLILLSVSLMKVRPEQRLNLKLGMKILQKIQNMLGQFTQSINKNTQ